MKSLNTYISEKLLINKNHDFCEYNCVEPNNNGVCLELSLMYNKNVFKKDDYKIVIRLKEYKYDKTTNTVITGYSEYTKNDNGYYSLIATETYAWRWVLLFGNDALLFLHKLLNDPKEKINIEEICKDILDDDIYEYYCKNDDNDFYTNDKIQYMINKIK